MIFRKSIYILIFLRVLLAIEGQDPTPRFLSPDFSVDEEKVTYPEDLLEFFKEPFLEYLMSDTINRRISPFAEFSSFLDFAGTAKYSEKDKFARAEGKQLYFGSSNERKLYRSIVARGGYCGMLIDKYPFAITLDGNYGFFRGEYEPVAYIYGGLAEWHIPMGASLISLYGGGKRESWVQRPGPFPRKEPLDRERQNIANTMHGYATFKTMPGANTGFELFTSGVRKTRYSPRAWEHNYLALGGRLAMVYDSKPLRVAIGGSAYDTWAFKIISPYLSFDLNENRFYLKAMFQGFAEVPFDWNKLVSPRVALPSNAPYRKTPTDIYIDGIVILKPKQILRGVATYSRVENEPVIRNPLSEAPQISFESASHQAFQISLRNDFGPIKNILSITLKRDDGNGTHIPTEPTRILTDTISIEPIKDFIIAASGVQKAGFLHSRVSTEDNLALTLRYDIKKYSFKINFENILQDPIFDRSTLLFDSRMRFWIGVSANF